MGETCRIDGFPEGRAPSRPFLLEVLQATHAPYFRSTGARRGRYSPTMCADETMFARREEES